ncbi:MAG: RNA polymerase sigma factor [Acidobacteriota bacterium]|nr:RNA polymerase sigma factor [Blastocatellia bacterium]MDW8238389.1 RNA polymerase sigma factor [Acidobacteriota bacterium]
MAAQMVARLTDFQLARASAAGDHRAFEMLYCQHHRRVYSLCLRMLRNHEEAEDVTQEVFLQVYRKINSFQGNSAFTTWLHRLTVNMVLMYLRRKQKGHRQEETLEANQMADPLENRKQVGHPDFPIEAVDLQNAINDLPNGYRQVFILHDIEGYEHNEISQLLGISVGTAKSQLHKARLKLRQALRATHPQQLVTATVQ